MIFQKTIREKMQSTHRMIPLHHRPPPLPRPELSSFSMTSGVDMSVLAAAAGFIPRLETRTASLGSALAPAPLHAAPAWVSVFVTQLGRSHVDFPAQRKIHVQIQMGAASCRFYVCLNVKSYCQDVRRSPWKRAQQIQNAATVVLTELWMRNHVAAGFSSFSAQKTQNRS